MKKFAPKIWQLCHTLRMSNGLGFVALVIAMFSRTFPILKAVRVQPSAKFKRSCRLAFESSKRSNRSCKQQTESPTRTAVGISVQFAFSCQPSYEATVTASGALSSRTECQKKIKNQAA